MIADDTTAGAPTTTPTGAPSEPAEEASLPPEPPNGTWLHVPDLHGPGYADVLRRDDAAAYADPERCIHQEHWFSYHRRAWLPWKDAVRIGAAHARVLHLSDITDQR